MSLLDSLLLEEAWNKLGYLGPEAVLKSIGPSLLLSVPVQCFLYGLTAVLLPFRAAHLAGLPWALACLLYVPFQIVAFTLWTSYQHPPPLPLKTKETIVPVVVNAKEKLQRTVVVALGVVLWSAYMAPAAWGAANLPTRMEPSDFYKPGSTVYQAIQMEEHRFSDFLYRVHAVVDEPLEYSDPKIQQALRKLTDENPFNPAPDLTESWLKFYLMFLKKSGFITRKYNTSSPQGFTDCLQKVFLKVPLAHRFQQDLVFGNNSQIVKSRFQIQLMGFKDSITGRQVLKDLRAYTQTHIPFKVTFFHFLEPILEILNHLHWMLLTLAAASSLLLGILIFIFTSHFLPSIVTSLGLFGWQLGLLELLYLWKGELNGPSAIAMILFFGVGVKQASSVLPWLYSETSPFLPLIISTLGLTLGASTSFIVKAYTLITDKIIFIAFANSCLHFLLLYLTLILCRLETLPTLFTLPQFLKKHKKQKCYPPNDDNMPTTSV